MEKHGAIYPYNATIKELHPNGFCRLVRMRTKQAGTVTKKGISGADAYLKYTGTLPHHYVSKKDARKQGWIPERGNLADVLPGTEIGGDIFANKEQKLPTATGRIWYEADFDYYTGYRNDNRILYSSDGLIFISYDHYKTFYELI